VPEDLSKMLLGGCVMMGIRIGIMIGQECDEEEGQGEEGERV